MNLLEASRRTGAPPPVSGALTASDVLSDGTTTDESAEPGASRREVALRQNRASYRRRLYAAVAAEIADGDRQTFLETQAVKKKTRINYRAVFEQARSWVRQNGYRMVKDEEIDEGLCQFMNSHYFRVLQAHLGETLMSGFIDSNPSFVKYGTRRTPRAWRAVRAWRRLTPSRSRKPWPLMIGAAIAVTLALRQQPDMAKFLLLGLGTYARPSELLGLRKQDVIPPVRGMSKYGAIIIAPEDVGQTTKTGETNDSVLLDCSWMPW